jgi:hypothetical protein
LDVIEERLGSSPTSGRADDMVRARESLAAGAGAGLEDVVIENTGPILETALMVLEAAGWLPAEVMSRTRVVLRFRGEWGPTWVPRQADTRSNVVKYLLIVNFQPGVADTPMEEWKPEEIEAHLDYYRALERELVSSGELVESEALTGPDLAKVVTFDGVTAPVVTDGPFQEFKEWVAGYQIVDVESEPRAIEIAAKISAVPGPGGRSIEQPIIVRRIMDSAPSNASEMDAFLETASGVDVR